MPNDWTPQPPYPFDSPGKVDTPSGRARRQLLKTAFGALIAVAVGFLGRDWLFSTSKNDASIGGKAGGAPATANRVEVASASRLTAASEPVAVKVQGQQAFAEIVDGKPTVLSAVCPHQGCLVAWQAAQNKFVCPCHNSAFGRDGSLLQGPAKEPLERFTGTIQDGKVYVEG